MIRILCIETSSKFCSVSLIEKNKIVASKRIEIEKSHSEFILVLIDSILKEQNILLTQLSAVAVSKGPGSYTGLRIGVSTAKGLCYSLDLPLLSVNSLDLMAVQSKKKKITDAKALLCPMMDARRMEVYTKILNFDLCEVEETSSMILDKNSFEHLLNNNKIYFFGNGSLKFKKIVKSSNALFLDDVHPDASSFNELVSFKYSKKKFEDLINFEPYYLKSYYFKKK